MKKIRIWAVLAVLLQVVLGNGASNVFAQTTLSGAKKDAKILVAYFSHADENYNVGVIEKGNTQILAEFIAQELKADTSHINRYAVSEKLQGMHRCRFGRAEK